MQLVKSVLIADRLVPSSLVNSALVGADNEVDANLWWLSGGIAQAACVAAYRPKGALSYAASKINLATPGTYNAVDGAAFPTWNPTTGWAFLLASVQYLNTGITPGAITWSAFVQFANLDTAAIEMLIGSYGNGKFFALGCGTTKALYGNGSAATYISPALTSGNLGVAGANPYRNGVDDGAITQSTQSTRALFIGACNEVASVTYPMTGNIYAAAIYNVTPTQTQITSLVTTMARL